LFGARSCKFRFVGFCGTVRVCALFCLFSVFALALRLILAALCLSSLGLRRSKF
jgi:hypothetical protein